MNSITIHKMDNQLAKELKRRAKSESVSVNAMVKRLLAEALGIKVSKEPLHKSEFEPFLGLWSDEDAKEFKECVGRCSIKRDGFDFGFETSYNALVRVAVDLKESVLYIYDEWYRNKLTDKESAEKLIEWNPDVVNWRVKADCAQPGSIKYMKDEGFGFVKCHKYNRLEQVKKVKRFKRIVCSPKCKNTIRELEWLVYKQDSNGNLICDEFNLDPHTFSAIWYALDDVTVADVKKRKINSKKGG